MIYKKRKERDLVPAKDKVNQHDADKKPACKGRGCEGFPGGIYHPRNEEAKDQVDQFAEVFLHSVVPPPVFLVVREKGADGLSGVVEVIIGIDTL
jgi:hypothetical protein